MSESVLCTVANKVPGEAQQRGCVLRTGQVGGKPSITLLLTSKFPAGCRLCSGGSRLLNAGSSSKFPL